MTANGPLAGVKIVEMEGIGPGPFAAMLLADVGASVLQISRPGTPRRHANPILYRNRAGSIELDLKLESGRSRLVDLIAQADGLIEGMRPGVMERLGLGPDACLSRNPRLIYGRVTGWGRYGPLADSAGHDINFIALSGALHACGSQQSGPLPPLNLVGDFGGGGLMLAFGMVSAMFEARSSGKGQVVDTAMVDGAALLMSMMYGMLSTGRWKDQRASNLLDGSAWYYTTYPCADGKWIAVGAIELPFRKLLLEGLGLAEEADALMRASDQDAAVRARIAAIFATRSRDHWQQRFGSTDACVSPVLSMAEAPKHEHIRAWGSFRKCDDVVQPMPVPRFERTPAPVPTTGTIPSRLALWKGIDPAAGRAAGK